MTSYTFYPISTLTLDGITQCKIYNTSSVAVHAKAVPLYTIMLHIL